MPGYETIYITTAELGDDANKSIQQSLKKIVSKNKGSDVVHTDWGKRRLAYPIEKHSRGNYWYYCYTGSGNIPSEIDRALRLNDKILRFLTVKIADNETDPVLAQIAKEGGAPTSIALDEERKTRRERG